MEFKYDGGGLAKGGDVTLYVDGKPVGKGRVEQTVPMVFSADETCDVGKEGGSPVSPDYGPTSNEFSGEVNWVQIDLREGRPRPPDLAGGALPHRDGAAVVTTRGRRPHGPPALFLGARSMTTSFLARRAAALLFVAAAAGCSGPQQAPPQETPAASTAPAPAETQRGADSGHGLPLRRPARRGPGSAGQAVHRRPGRDAQAPRDSRRRDLQPHPLLHRPAVQERGLTYEALKAFETDLNTDLKTGNLKVHVVDPADVPRSAVTRPARAARWTWSPRW